MGQPPLISRHLARCVFLSPRNLWEWTKMRADTHNY